MKDSRVEELFAGMAGKISQATGSFWTFTFALLIVIVWAASGPVFHYSETWQLVITTGTTIITFLMVFVIQHAQNKDMRAVQLKLNELIAAVEGASNRLIDVEDLTDRELEHLYNRFQNLAKSARKVSHGAKLTIDSSDEGNEDEDEDDDDDDDADDSLSDALELAHGHPHSERSKKPVSVKPEAKKHAKKSDS